jgi:hypothetical protein
MYRRTVRGETTNPELHEQFRRNPLFAPRAIRGDHLRDQLPEVGWHARSGLWPRFSNARTSGIPCDASE